MNASPLAEFVSRSHKRGQCSSSGAARGFPVPWAFTLATSSARPDAPPSVRNLGLHGVDADGFVFACRGHPGGAAGGAPPAPSDPPVVASMCFLAGNYPRAGFEEQWRAEGECEPLDPATLDALDADLQVQVCAAAAFAEARLVVTGAPDPADDQGRLLLTTAEDAKKLASCLAAVEAKRASDPNRAVPLSDARCAGFRCFRLKPWRVEMVEGGPSWPEGPRRVEWRKIDGTSDWSGPTRVLPYNVPLTERTRQQPWEEERLIVRTRDDEGGTTTRGGCFRGVATGQTTTEKEDATLARAPPRRSALEAALAGYALVVTALCVALLLAYSRERRVFRE